VALSFFGFLTLNGGPPARVNFDHAVIEVCPKEGAMIVRGRQGPTMIHTSK